jgi:serine/threonine protein kinase
MTVTFVLQTEPAYYNANPHYLYGWKLINRDIKPESLLLDGYGQVLLSDSGTAIKFGMTHVSAYFAHPTNLFVHLLDCHFHWVLFEHPAAGETNRYSEAAFSDVFILRLNDVGIDEYPQCL